MWISGNTYLFVASYTAIKSLSGKALLVSARIRTHSYRCLTACSQFRLFCNNKIKIRKPIEWLKSYIKLRSGNLSLFKLQQLASSTREAGLQHSGKHGMHLLSFYHSQLEIYKWMNECYASHVIPLLTGRHSSCCTVCEIMLFTKQPKQFDPYY